MAYAPHTLVAFGGTLTDPAAASDKDVWQVGIRCTQLDDPTHSIDDPVAFMNGIATPLNNWWHGGSNCNATYATLNWLKVNNIGADGKYQSGSATNVHDYTSPQAGGAVATHPLTQSCAYSWRGARTRGPGANGRIYLPNATLGDGASLDISGTNRNSFAAAAKALLTLLNVGDGDLAAAQPVIASKVDASLVPITTIRIGNTYDEQRRRRNAWGEAYTEISAT